MKTPSTKQRDTITGQAIVVAATLTEIKKELLQLSSTHKVSQVIGQCTKAWEEANGLLRYLGYLLEEPDVEPGPEKTLELEEVNNV